MWLLSDLIDLLATLWVFLTTEGYKKLCRINPIVAPRPSFNAPNLAGSIPFDPNRHTHESNLELFKCLSTSCGKRARLPTELILQIIALPSRWILHSHDALSDPMEISNRQAQSKVVQTGAIHTTDITLIRKITFTWTSKDQGWSSHPSDRGTFRNSWTWFDVEIMRDGRKRIVADSEGEELHEHVYSTQRNRHASRDWETYRIDLEVGHQIFEDLQDGDSVVLWAKARFPGWTNYVKEAAVEVWWEDSLKGLQCDTEIPQERKVNHES